MRLRTWVRHIFWNHPLFWLVVGLPLFLHLSRLPVDSWNVEILIARNLLEGHGFVVGPLDPPALWRPPLAVFLLLPIEILFENPVYIYAAFGTLTMLGLMVGVFYLMKLLGGPVAAHVSQLLLLITPAFTTLIGHQLQLLSYLLLFGLVPFSVWVTLRSWYRLHWRRDVLAGLCWGLAFLARPEVVMLFGIGLLVGVVCYRRLGVSRAQAGWRALFQASAFLAIYLPSVLIFTTVQKSHNLVGQEPLVTHYAGALHAGGKWRPDPDGSGYLDSVKAFGAPEKYQNSMVRFTLAHPQAIKTRVVQNAKQLYALFKSDRLILFWGCVAFLVLSSALVFARRPSLPALPLMLYFTSLVAASPYFLLFHVDVRYCLLSVLLLVLWLLLAALLLWTRVASSLGFLRKGRWIFAVPTLGLVLICGQRLGLAITTAKSEVLDPRPWRQLAQNFRKYVGQGGTPVMGFSVASGHLMFGGDYLWASYYAQTALPWCGRPGCYQGNYFPRDRIYSFTGKAQEFLWIPDNKLSKVKLPKEIVAQHVRMDPFGAYTLLHLSPPGSPLIVEGVHVNNAAQ